MLVVITITIIPSLEVRGQSSAELTFLCCFLSYPVNARLASLRICINHHLVGGDSGAGQRGV